MIVRAEQEFLRGCAICTEDGDYSSVEALRVLETLSGHTAAMTGAQTDRMTRDDGWRLLSSGRHLERLGFLASALESAIRDRRRVRRRRIRSGGGAVRQHDHLPRPVPAAPRHPGPARPAGAGPRQPALARLGGADAARAAGETGPAARRARCPTSCCRCPIPSSGRWRRCASAMRKAATARCWSCCGNAPTAAYQLSDDLGARYFTHSGEARQSVGA